MTRVGIGYDIHRLVEGRKLVLGGVDIPYGKGLIGHSDADVLIHAIMDALLGAAGLFDIGHYFSPSDSRWANISSLILLEKVKGMVCGDRFFRIANIDSVIVAENPRLSPYVDQMRKNISDVLKIPCSSIMVKATTNEGLGPEGLGQGISARAAVLLESAVASPKSH